MHGGEKEREKEGRVRKTEGERETETHDGERCRLRPHIRGSPDVTGTRKSNGIREEGNERDVVSQMFLQGGGRHTAHRCTAEFLATDIL